MKIRHKASWPMMKVIPKDPANGIYEDKEHHYIGTASVFKVDDLIDWCKDNPDVPAKDLAASIERGEFG